MDEVKSELAEIRGERDAMAAALAEARASLAEAEAAARSFQGQVMCRPSD